MNKSHTHHTNKESYGYVVIMQNVLRTFVLLEVKKKKSVLITLTHVGWIPTENVYIPLQFHLFFSEVMNPTILQ